MTRRSFCPNLIVLQYLSQKSTGNPVVGRGMIKLLKPLHFARIGAIEIAASKDICDRNACDRQSSAGPIICRDEQKVQCLLKPSKKHCPSPSDLAKSHLAKPDLAKQLWDYIDHIPECRRHNLIEKLNSADISRMWDIAGYNNTANNSCFLTHINESKLISPGSWRGKAARKDIKEFVGLHTSYFPKPGLKHFKMDFFGGNDGHMHGVIKLDDQSCELSFIVKDVIGVKNQGVIKLNDESCELSVIVKDVIGVKNQGMVASNPEQNQNTRVQRWFLGKFHKRSDAKKVHDEAVEYANCERQHREDPKELSKPGEIYIRCAGPNVLVGKLRLQSKFSKEILVIKDINLK